MKWRSAAFIFLTIISQPSLAQIAGYKTISLTDSARHYKPGIQKGNRFEYRPVEIDFWYPGNSTIEKPIAFGEFLRLFQERANRFQDDTVYSSIASEMTQYLCAGLNIPDSSDLTSFKTKSYRNITKTNKRYPLIIYLCSYNGMSYENILLFEWLASHGYVVASITSVGRYPGNMSIDPADLKEQVGDALFALENLKSESIIDSTKIGLIGYSWGGSAALQLVNQPGVCAVLSLDGSELHYYGQTAEEDVQFNRLRSELLPFLSSTIAYGYLESDNKQTDGPADSIFNFLNFYKGPKKYILFKGTKHEDFSCLPFYANVIKRNDTIQTNNSNDTLQIPRYILLAELWFDYYLKNEKIKLPDDSPYPVVKSEKNEANITGRIFDARDRTSLAYVNVGIPGKNKGTVTDKEGRFQLSIDSLFLNDSLAISIVGYEKKWIPIRKMPRTIYLNRKENMLNEVAVINHVNAIKTLGNKTTSKFISVGFPTRFQGAEIGEKISLGRNTRRLETFHCRVSDTRVDSAIFRLNIYKLVNGVPENILDRNILFTVHNGLGDYSVGLSNLRLNLSGDILVTVELLRTYSSLPNPGAVFFSAALLNSGTWRRQTSQAEWKKALGIGVGFNIDVR